MLTKDIRQTIDNARDILVGKIPNPQSQIEQITIAMIYKFMDDMDLESVEFGGERQYFVEELEKYAWSKIMSSQLGNEERMSLYTEALEKLPLSIRIPKLFRDIFKNAYLPFRDGQTLTLFLKEINDLSYSNSENLGNGFEYLLSIMGSQGDAGQFRTPRHIIDFIVNCVQPKKTDTILDPACGTAGFLISAYKYILNEAKENNQVLTPAELTTLTENIQGYDISPDMVKLALVNLYLHKFKNPKINEYDTLTNLTRWEEYFDCILANPPFMTPKGGIQPHNRFSVKANRSEVLFVDYIMEHINSTGKAGIVVPEGIIFQSTTAAYRQLRKKLVDENYLYAVVSLPSGVFNPYSGVKTSILLMDKQLAKKTDKILFIDIKQDGYDLGAQRRETPDKNDLPEALELIHQWQYLINSNVELVADNFSKSSLAILVDKSKLAEDGKYSLNSSKYKEVQDYTNCKWNTIKLGELLDYEQPTNYIVESIEYNDNYKTPVLTAGQSFILGYTNEETGIFNNLPVIIFDDFTTSTKFVDFPFKVKSSAMKILKLNNSDIADIKYIYYIMQNIKFDSSTHKRYWISEYSNIEIPLPPLEVQKDIVKELEGYQAVIDGAKKIVENWKPTLPINPIWEKVKLGDVCDFIRGPFGGSLKKEIFVKEGYLVYEQYHAINNDFDFGRYYIDEQKYQEMKRFTVNSGDLLVSCSGTMGKIAIVPENHKVGIINQALLKLTANENLNNLYLKYLLESDTYQNKYFKNQSGVAIQNVVSVKELKEMFIPLPNIEEQINIVNAIETEKNIVIKCKKLVELHQEKINNKIKSIWGDN